MIDCASGYVGGVHDVAAFVGCHRGPGVPYPRSCPSVLAQGVVAGRNRSRQGGEGVVVECEGRQSVRMTTCERHPEPYLYELSRLQQSTAMPSAVHRGTER